MTIGTDKVIRNLGGGGGGVKGEGAFENDCYSEAALIEIPFCNYNL